MEYNSKIYASVCILTKNPGENFKNVLTAVIEQEVDFSFEIIVIDSGSTDGSINFIRSMAMQYNCINLYEINPDDFGHGKTRNYAIEKSLGEFVVMITHDALPVTKHWLKNLLEPFDDKDVAGVFGRHEAYENASIFLKRDLKIHFDNFKNNDKVVYNNDPFRYKNDIGYRQYLHYFSDNNAALRKSIWKKYPYPDVDFAEDQLWAQQIIEAGYKKGYADNAAVFHSHNYNLRQTFSRSFDESRALKKLFNYNLAPSILLVLYQIFACSSRDIKYAIHEQKTSVFPILQFISVPIYHTLRQIGFYLGNKFSNSRLIFRLLSLDYSLKRK